MSAATWVAALWCVASANAAAAVDVPALQARADAMYLHDQPQWHALLHVAPRVLRPGQASDITSDWFFLSGEHDTRAELHATLRGFADPAPTGPRAEPARCLFGARFAWLTDQLAISPDAFPEVDCSRRDDWITALNPQRLWVVFPSAYLNSPASMFGHTLLRIDGAAGRDNNALLAYAVNYAAETDEANGLAFAIKGLTGGYRGSYAVMPYYEKLRDYSRIENRDLWEYPLDFGAEDMQFLLLHLWELRGVGFDYFFLNRNCAYQLQTLLRVLRPDAGLIDGFRYWSIPTDTVRRLREAGLASGARFRPALATRLADRWRQVDANMARVVERVVHGGLAPDAVASLAATPTRAARALDVAHDWAYYRYQHGVKARDEALPLARAILGARAALGVPSEFADPAPPAASPEQGHDTGRWIAGGFADSGAAGARLRWRPAYHDYLDPPAGYDAESRLGFFDLSVVADTRNDRAVVDRLGLIDIVSAAPRSVISQPISWFAWAGGRRRFSAADPFEGVIEAGPGLAFGGFRDLGAAVFATVGGETVHGRGDGYRVEMGARGLLVAQLSTTVRAQLAADVRHTVAGERRRWRQAEIGLQWQAHGNWALRASSAVYALFEQTNHRGELALVRYW